MAFRQEEAPPASTAIAPLDDGGEVQLLFNRIFNEGKQVEATSRSIDINKRPEYFDQKRMDKAQMTCQKYYSNISMASSSGLVILLQIESILVPLLRTGKSRTVPDLYDRYTATGKYIRKCYETKFYDPSSEGWRYVMMVRGMHQRIHKLMNDDQETTIHMTNKSSEPTSNQEFVWVNQWDMILTQFAFVGFFLLYPDKCAAYHIKDQELKDIIYFWRVLSYYFGIEDRFNLFALHENLTKQMHLLRLILDHKRQLMDQSRQSIGTLMAEGFLLAFEDLSSEVNFNILDHWWAPIISLSGKKELTPYTLGERWKFIVFSLYFRVLFRSDFIMGLMNRMYKRKFDKFCEKGDKIKKKLHRKYKDHIYELKSEGR